MSSIQGNCQQQLDVPVETGGGNHGYTPLDANPVFLKHREVGG